MLYDIVILTEHRYINPKKKDWYIKQVLLEDQILLEELSNLDLNVCKKDWSDKSFIWSNTKYAIFRTTWDYFNRYEEFFNWIEETKNKTKFINTAEIIKWNVDKKYLKELSDKGINIAPTIFIEKNKHQTLKNLFKRTNWKEAVIKPAVSGAARHTYRISSNNYKKFENIFKELVKNECMLFQEFLNSIVIKGEISLIVVNGIYTHAVKKTAKKGDFRVQDDHGGKVERYDPNKNEIKFAEKCINKCLQMPMYARVDLIYDNNNKISLSELELIEPELWFRKNKSSAKLLAKSIKNKLFSK